MSFEYYYITVVGLVIFIVAIVIALVMNERYFRLIKSYLSQTKEAEAHGGGQALSGEVEVLMCPRCGFTKTIPFRLGDYVGKVTNEACPNDGERLVVHAIYYAGPSSQGL
ncbi:hypothetical protein B7L70_03225 [Vulcanisaeta sp. EB80]|jgi:hypothetical protein|uniref:hypothetical protein n=1 Tax=Vulcanisaeta sp. EB80 TaxID=1650660 RepID=UPI000749DBE5|nr:hypothetical protein [Vulcanisaeta sp. EB80]KUO82566.1 MAG: hypothetical protein AT714_00990 [Vulcanisaeta sp. OSP_8]MCG2865129.1 hypothetical protein [Vulcanisaeta sp.]PLC68478.1 hypothetical protein B7L70_03225 [Vulcanisaeta sp. EB80]